MHRAGWEGRPLSVRARGAMALGTEGCPGLSASRGGLPEGPVTKQTPARLGSRIREAAGREPGKLTGGLAPAF